MFSEPSVRFQLQLDLIISYLRTQVRWRWPSTINSTFTLWDQRCRCTCPQVTCVIRTTMFASFHTIQRDAKCCLYFAVTGCACKERNVFGSFVNVDQPSQLGREITFLNLHTHTVKLHGLYLERRHPAADHATKTGVGEMMWRSQLLEASGPRQLHLHQ